MNIRLSCDCHFEQWHCKWGRAVKALISRRKWHGTIALASLLLSGCLDHVDIKVTNGYKDDPFDSKIVVNLTDDRSGRAELFAYSLLMMEQSDEWGNKRRVVFKDGSIIPSACSANLNCFRELTSDHQITNDVYVKMEIPDGLLNDWDLLMNEFELITQALGVNVVQLDTYVYSADVRATRAGTTISPIINGNAYWPIDNYELRTTPAPPATGLSSYTEFHHRLVSWPLLVRQGSCTSSTVDGGVDMQDFIENGFPNRDESYPNAYNPNARIVCTENENL